MVAAALEDVWGAVDAATPAGWQVCQPSLHEERRQWIQYAWDPSERSKAGARSRDWEAVGRSELEVLYEMARCLGEIKAGRVPR